MINRFFLRHYEIELARGIKRLMIHADLIAAPAFITARWQRQSYGEILLTGIIPAVYERR